MSATPQHPIRHIFFDLDHTLWDFEANSQATLAQMYQHFGLHHYFSHPQHFLHTFQQINTQLWAEYHRGNITKERLCHQRFYQLLRTQGHKDHALATQMDTYYLHQCPRHTQLMPNALPTLEHLRHQGYTLHIITNGFNEVQHTKLQSAALTPYFQYIITSQNANSLKPHPQIFAYAQQQAQAAAHQCLIVGDDWVNDIQGAQRAGWHQAYYNPHHQPIATSPAPTIQIADLAQLQHWL